MSFIITRIVVASILIGEALTFLTLVFDKVGEKLRQQLLIPNLICPVVLAPTKRESIRLV